MEQGEFMLKKILLLPLIILLLLMSATTSVAEPPPPPTPWYNSLGDGLIFYMTPTEYEELGYPKSGLYRNGELIYTVESYLYRSYLYFSSDRMSFLYVPSTGGSLWVAGFFKQGERLLEHTLSDLLRRPERVPETTIGYFWDVWNERIYSRENNTLQVTTVEGTQIIFDITTGLIIHPEIMPPRGILGVIIDNAKIIGLGILTGVVLIMLLVKLKRRK
jgi:hypothetical protein